MMRFSSRCSHAPRATALIPGAMLMCAVAFGVRTVPIAHAAIGACGSDPIVALSNGTELEFSTAIAGANVDVQQVRYTLHVPSGTQAVLSVAGALGAEEQWTMVADMPAHTYEAITQVTADTPGAVTVTVQALDLIGVALDTASGQVNQDVVVRLTL